MDPSTTNDLLCIRQFVREKSRRKVSPCGPERLTGLKMRTSRFGRASRIARFSSDAVVKTSSRRKRTRTPRSAASISACAMRAAEGSASSGNTARRSCARPLRSDAGARPARSLRFRAARSRTRTVIEPRARRSAGLRGARWRGGRARFLRSVERDARATRNRQRDKDRTRLDGFPHRRPPPRGRSHASLEGAICCGFVIVQLYNRHAFMST